MKEYAGIWIDRKEAIIVCVLGEEKTVTTLKSKITEQDQIENENMSCYDSSSKDIPEGIESEKTYKKRVSKYYQKVLDTVEESDKILVLGPDDMKKGVEQEMKKNRKFASKFAGIRTAGEINVNQIAEQVKAFFRNHQNDPPPKTSGRDRRKSA